MIGHFDLDNFKAYNDIYGFLKGDEIIKFTADIIYKNIHKFGNRNDFIGHIGGDDFVAIVPETNYDDICQNIIADFDANVTQDIIAINGAATNENVTLTATNALNVAANASLIGASVVATR